MKGASLIFVIGIAALVVVAGLLATPLVLAERVSPRVYLGNIPLGGVSSEDIEGVLKEYEKDLLTEEVTVQLRDKEVKATLSDLGFSLDVPATRNAIEHESRLLGLSFERHVQPVLNLNGVIAREVLHEQYKDVLALPKNADLVLQTGKLVLVKGSSGEQVDLITFERDVEEHVSSNSTQDIPLVAISAAAPVQDNEVEDARVLAEKLLKDGMELRFQVLDETTEYDMKPFTIQRLLTFAEIVDPSDPKNTILGVKLDEKGLQDYLATTISPEIDQEPINARFEIDGEETAEVPTPAVPEGQTAIQLADVGNLSGRRVAQFAVPQRGQSLNVEESAGRIAQAISAGQTSVDLAVTIVEPEVTDIADINALGVSTLLARGESNFAGSPVNRVHNVRVGAEKYHGLLIAPGEEFSFNKFLGPVDASGGFKPELVIKQNVTIPEFGGGLCQVSTTIFRAAVYSGMEITTRRNHSYAVSYYGTPGFDATIYPPYTDFRFLNNTPGYILIQTKIEGTKLYFEFWGTDDGREVTVEGPQPYNRQPDGAVKAVLKQSVSKDGQVIVEDTFYSNYKSPKLFPKVLSANGETPPPVTPPGTPPTNEPTINTTSPTPTPTSTQAPNQKP